MRVRWLVSRAGAACVIVAALVGGCATVVGLEAPDTAAGKQHCINGVRDKDELDIDCGGGDCLACGGAACEAGEECQSGTCKDQKCLVPTCSDGVFDGYESSLDCGDPRGGSVACPACNAGIHCWNGCNCASGFCDPETHTCGSETSNCDRCADGVKEDDEADVDCGGSCSTPCDDGKACTIDGDCQSAHCAAGVCRMATCYDGLMNGDETGVDCGGACPLCDGSACAIDGQCQSEHCIAQTCTNHCEDHMLDADESDKDCGGSSGCPRCADGANCLRASDCSDGRQCVASKCVECIASNCLQ